MTLYKKKFGNNMAQFFMGRMPSSSTWLLITDFCATLYISATTLQCIATLYGCPAAMAAIVLRAILPDLVFGRRGTMITSLKLATGPTSSRTFAITSLMRFVRPIDVSDNVHKHTLCRSCLAILSSYT